MKQPTTTSVQWDPARAAVTQAPALLARQPGLAQQGDNLSRRSWSEARCVLQATQGQGRRTPTGATRPVLQGAGALS